MTGYPKGILPAPGTHVRTLPVDLGDGTSTEPAEGIVLDYDAEHCLGTFPVELLATGQHRVLRIRDVTVTAPPGGIHSTHLRGKTSPRAHTPTTTTPATKQVHSTGAA